MPATSTDSRRDLCATEVMVRADSVNDEHRTFEAVISTDQPVQVFDMRSFKIIDEILVGRGGSFPVQIPLLANHSRFSLDDVLGHARHFKLTAEGWVARMHLVEGDESADRAWNKVRQDAISDVSIGYQVAESVTIDAGKSAIVAGKRYEAKERDLRVSTAWRGHEVSLVPIGADPDAKIRRAVELERMKRHVSTTETLSFKPWRRPEQLGRTARAVRRWSPWHSADDRGPSVA